MYRRTGEFFGINEALFSSALAAMVFSILAAQPLTIVGVTGLISLFNFTIYDIIKIYDISIYPQFMAWTAIWAAIFHWIVAVFNLCDYMRYVTDFSSEAFGMYVGIIYISKFAYRAAFSAELCDIEVEPYLCSQGSRGARQRIHNRRQRSRLLGRRYCYTVLWVSLWSREAGFKHGVACWLPWLPCRLCLRRKSSEIGQPADCIKD
jgi:hypothetical protein